MASIVVSYRRDDAKAMAHRIFQELADKYGQDHLFIDIDNIPFGVDFREHIRNTMEGCDVLLAVIGPRWFGAGGDNRVLDETDWVRIEIETALKRKIPVVPILVEEGRMPKPDQLPPSLEPFAFRHYAVVDSGADFRHHVQRVMRSLDDHLKQSRPKPKPPTGEIGPGDAGPGDQPPAGAAAPKPPTAFEEIKQYRIQIAAAAGVILILWGLNSKGLGVLVFLGLGALGYAGIEAWQEYRAKSDNKP